MDAADAVFIVVVCSLCIMLGFAIGLSYRQFQEGCPSAQPVRYTFAMDGLMVEADCTRAVSSSCGWSLSGCSDGREYECVTNLAVGEEGS